MPLVAPRRLTAAEAYPLSGGVPYRLNTSTIADATGAHPQDNLGTLAFAPEFLRRLEAAVRAELWEDHLPYSEWPRSPYVVARLAAAFGWPILHAVLAYRRAVRDLAADETYQEMDDWRAYRPYRDATLAAAVTPLGYTARQVERAQRQIDAMVRGRLMSYRPNYQWRRERVPVPQSA